MRQKAQRLADQVDRLETVIGDRTGFDATGRVGRMERRIAMLEAEVAVLRDLKIKPRRLQYKPDPPIATLGEVAGQKKRAGETPEGGK